MNEIEEITDMLTPKGIKDLRKGMVLKFEFEGSITSLKVTKKYAGRVWAEHIQLVDMNIGMSHYGHNIDRNKTPVWCEDCKSPVTKSATLKGDKKAFERERKAAEKKGGKDGKK